MRKMPKTKQSNPFIRNLERERGIYIYIYIEREREREREREISS